MSFAKLVTIGPSLDKVEYPYVRTDKLAPRLIIRYMLNRTAITGTDLCSR